MKERNQWLIGINWISLDTCCDPKTDPLQNGVPTECKCDPRGTVDEICDKGSGECLCKPGYFGARCDQCSPGFYGYPTCRECNCSGSGSLSTICAPNGKCPCDQRFSGRACDQCSVGYFKYPECLSKSHSVAIRFHQSLNETLKDP